MDSATRVRPFRILERADGRRYRRPILSALIGSLQANSDPNALGERDLEGMPEMRRWFLSYNSQDLALMQGFEAALERGDPDAKVYSAPKSVRVGGFWMPELTREIAEATAFVLLVGEKGVGPWQVMEYYEALDRRVKRHDFPVVLVLLDGRPAPGLPFLRQLHWIVTADPASEKSIAQVIAATADHSLPRELWRHTAPYRGLAAMEEKDSDYFFGRTRETIEVLDILGASSGRLPVLIGNSGVGKSSLAQAGVLAALKRQAWPEDDQGAANAWPHVFANSRRWCFLTLRPGVEPVRSLVEVFLETWRLDRMSTDWAVLLNDWIDKLVAGKLKLRDLLDQTRRRYAELQQPEPPAYFLYVDQGEELYARAGEDERRCFSKIVAEALREQRLRAIMSLRADFFGELLKDEPLQDVSRKIEVPPLRQAQLQHVVSQPAKILSARFETDHLAEDIAKHAAKESTEDAGALPLLSYLLDDMWSQMVRRGDGVLRLPAETIDLGRVLVQRADKFLADNPSAEDKLRRIFTLKLANVREDGEATRRLAYRSEFSDDEWRLVGELADNPNRLLVTVTREVGETYAEVAHEAIFRRWDRLRDWITSEREFLIWRSGLERDFRRWQAAPAHSKEPALLMGFALSQAQDWTDKRLDSLAEPLRDFVARSGELESKRREAERQADAEREKAKAEREEAEAAREMAEAEAARLHAENEAHKQRERADAEKKARLGAELAVMAARRRAKRLRILASVLAAMIVAGVIKWQLQAMQEDYYWLTQVRPHVLTPAREHALKAGDMFRECARACPGMIVLPAGEFMMGSTLEDKDSLPQERPPHPVKIPNPFAVGVFDVTFDEWDACYSLGGCQAYPTDGRTDTKSSEGVLKTLAWGRGLQPVINVGWNDAKQYVAWLSRMTGQTYRLLSEAEWEYAVRAKTSITDPQTSYSFGNDPSLLDQHAWYKANSGEMAHPVGQRQGNGFGLFDMHGNVFQWVEDCAYLNGEHPIYEGAPSDGTPWISDNCSDHIYRGGSWKVAASYLRSAFRDHGTVRYGSSALGFRVARTLSP
jgi:formylglycine-generating enzyme required for sulfatase activity